MTDMQGGCLCGKVRYTISAEPVFTGVCHCTDCQKATGSAFNIVVAVPSSWGVGDRAAQILCQPRRQR